MLAHRLRPLALALLFVAACSGDSDEMSGPGPDPDPDPEFDIDIVVFRVWSLEAAGAEKLRWVGTSEGPLPDSPEPTRWPWIGYARGFRVEWRAYSEDAPISGTRYRVSQLDTGPWLPTGTSGDPVWGNDTGFRFENLLDESALPPEGCPEGRDCVGDLRFDSGRYRIQVRAITEEGREIDRDLGWLEFEINYPPTTSIVFDPAGGPDDPLASPVAFWTLQDGSTRTVALAPGDTVPSGATLRVRLRGTDRLRSTTDTDSFCCDERLGGEGPQVSFQGNTAFVRESVRGERDSLFTLVGETSADSVFLLPLGPFDYSAQFRSRDEHGRRGDLASLEFVAGYPPLRPDTTIEDGSEVYLHPERDPAPGEGEFTRSLPVTLNWDSSIGGWSESGGSTPLTGRWYEIPLRFRGDPDPRVGEVSEDPPANASPFSAAYSDHVRAFAYELVHERDPRNFIANGPADRAEVFLDADSLGVLDLEGERAWRLFLPDLVFESPESFDPEGSPANDAYREIGYWMLDRLGEIELRLRSRTSRQGSTFHQLSPEAARDLVVDLNFYGRYSPVRTKSFSVRLGLTDGSGNLIGVWPPASP